MSELIGMNKTVLPHTPNFQVGLALATLRSVCLGMLLPALISCQSTAPKAASVDVKESTVELQLSTNQESLLSPGSTEFALKTRAELLKTIKQNESERKSDRRSKPGASGAEVGTDELMLTVSELSLLGGDFANARDVARARLKRNYNDVQAMNVLIRASLLEGKIKETYLLVDNALQVEPRNPTTLNLKGLALYQDGKLIEAREVWKLAQKYDPTHVASMMNLAALYFENRNIALAGTLFERVISLQPDHYDARIGFALVRYAQGDVEQGRALLNKVQEVKSDEPLVLYNLAIIERDGFQNYPRALALMERFIETATKIPSARKAVELGLAQISGLRAKIAAQNEKLSDEDLRSIASSPGGENAGAGTGNPDTRAQAGGDNEPGSQLMDKDVQSLEDAIK